MSINSQLVKFLQDRENISKSNATKEERAKTFNTLRELSDGNLTRC